MLRLAGIAELMLLAVSAAADALVFAEQAGGNRNLAERPAAMRKADLQVNFAARSSHARLNFRRLLLLHLSVHACLTRACCLWHRCQ